jgi:hypothetical protein
MAYVSGQSFRMDGVGAHSRRPKPRSKTGKAAFRGSRAGHKAAAVKLREVFAPSKWASIQLN